MLVDELERASKHGIDDMFQEVSFDEKDLLPQITDHFLERSTELGEWQPSRDL